MDKKEQGGEASDNVSPILSSLEKLPAEILRRMMACEVQPPYAIIQNQGGCLRYELNPSVLLTSKTVFEKCIEPWTCNRLVRITYRGDASYRPTAFVPVAANNAYRILTMSPELVRTTFTADLNVCNERSSDEVSSAIPMENVCVMTVDAACTWLAILGCQQFAEHVYHESPPAFRIELIVHESSKMSSPTGGDLHHVMALMLQSATDLSVNTVGNTSNEVPQRQERIWSAPFHTMVTSGFIYSTWVASLQTHSNVLPSLRGYEARLDYCACVCKQLIGINRLEPRSDVGSLQPSEKSLIAQRSCAALLNWTYEYHRNPRDEGSLERLRESWKKYDNDTCDIQGCPCLLWTGLDLGSGRVVPRDEAKGHGIHFLPWLEVHRWTVALHCRRRVAEGDSDGLVDAMNQMLAIKAHLQPEELQSDFAQDLESFQVAGVSGIRNLADCRGIAMVDEDDDTQVDVLWSSLKLEGERFAEPTEWRVQECGMLLEAAERTPSPRVEGDIVPAQLLASLLTSKGSKTACVPLTGH